MPSEIEVISHQPPYLTPPNIAGLPPARALEVLNSYVQRLHDELIVGYKELVECVNTLFDRFNRLPIGPEITTPASGELAFTDEGSGVVSIDRDQSFLVRGNLIVDINDFTDTQRQFTTSANATYHVRWDATNGLRYRDLADAGYNPGALPATDNSFQSTDTDVLLQQIDTDGANVPTFTAIPQFARTVVSGQTHIPNDVLISGGVGGSPNLLLRDTLNSGNSAQSSIALQDSTPTTQGTIGFTSGSDSHLEITNSVTDGDIELTTTGDGQVRTNTDIVLTNGINDELQILAAGSNGLTFGIDTPLVNIQDTNSNGDAATPRLRYLQSTGLLLADIGFQSGSDSTFTIHNRQDDNPLRFVTEGTTDHYFILTQGSNTIHFRIKGSALTENDPDGSIGINVNGTAGNVLHVREAGSWAAK